MTSEAPALKRTQLYDAHLKAGAKMVPFAGWEMPVSYPGGIIAEVRAVRTAAGMFDVSHMGRLRIAGANAASFLDTVCSADVSGLAQRRSKYHLICNERGGIIDDAIVYRLDADECLLVVNAGNKDAVLGWIMPRARAAGGVTVRDTSPDFAMIAVQGPSAVDAVDRLSGGGASQIRPFRIGEIAIEGTAMLAGRTGYTGEDGFEVMPPSRAAALVWDQLLEAGVQPCGLGARDVCRLEAGLMLHGVDMTVENNPHEAGLDRFVRLDSPGYVAADALKRIGAEGTLRVIVGLRMLERAIPRHGHTIHSGGGNGTQVGIVTSGTHSPTLDADIGMGYVDRTLASPGTELKIDVRGRQVDAEVASLPFYARKRS
ncbi:MAG: glycine cleavage system aminomethyltransferase GcvT [Chloroflexi bacterium]|nr:glycine cleavage system aminomethyltransferase GcvT [Chloroflexota bacterium]